MPTLAKQLEALGSQLGRHQRKLANIQKDIRRLRAQVLGSFARSTGPHLILHGKKKRKTTAAHPHPTFPACALSSTILQVDKLRRCNTPLHAPTCANRLTCAAGCGAEQQPLKLTRRRPWR